jgi:L-lactate dehydrogenase complex protein LldF
MKLPETSSNMAHLNANAFGSSARAALQDQPLRSALAKATDTFADRRGRVLDEMPAWEELRSHGSAIKAEALSRLHHHLARFVREAEARGTRIHFARNRAEACQVVEGLADRLGAKTIVKSKSMVTEEIGLNAALEARGLEPVETDLGEWIVQLAGETPSHIIVPAIHKSKDEIARLFKEKLGTDEDLDAEELTAVARKILRGTYLEAELGISGVNFAIAETGSFLVLENEGNARLSTSLPRVHLAVMGLEKLLPRWQDLETFLRLLPRSGTGQHLTSYQSIFTGPKQRPEDEGPDEVHVLILDNGRSAVLEDDVARETLACIRCGACLNVCPVYRQVGGHAYGSVYPGPIGAIVTPQLVGTESAVPLPSASSLCGACRDVCPVKIDIPRILLHLRGKVVERMPTRAPLERLGFRLWALAAGSPWRWRLATRLGRPLARVAASASPLGRLARRLVPPLQGWTHGRTLPKAAKVSFRERHARSQASGGAR